MKKKYVAPESEYVDFEAEDVVTSVQTVGGIEQYSNADGDSPEMGTETPSNPDIESPFD